MELARQKKLLRGAAKLLHSFPAQGVLPRARQASRAVKAAQLTAPHYYQWHQGFGRFVCSVCQHSKEATRPKRDRSACVPLNGLVRQLARAGPALEHMLWLAPAVEGVCGAYAELRGNALRRKCKPASTQKSLLKQNFSASPTGKPGSRSRLLVDLPSQLLLQVSVQAPQLGRSLGAASACLLPGRSWVAGPLS